MYHLAAKVVKDLLGRHIYILVKKAVKSDRAGEKVDSGSASVSLARVRFSADETSALPGSLEPGL